MLKRTKAMETKRPASPKQPTLWAGIPVVIVEDEQIKVKECPKTNSPN